MNIADNCSIVRETVISCVEAQRLREVLVWQFIQFKWLWDLYEKQTEEKSRHVKEEIVATSLKESKDDEDLEIFLAIGWIAAASIDKITKSQIKECINESFKRHASGEHLYLVDQAVKSVAMNSSIAEVEDRIWSMRKDYCDALGSAGYV